jgi:hypothetical protein
MTALRVLLGTAVVLALTGCTSNNAESRSQSECNVSPRLFCEPFKDLTKRLSLSDVTNIRDSTPKSFVTWYPLLSDSVISAYDLGGANDLTRYFHSVRLDHPYIMSVHFLCAYRMWVRNEATAVESLVGLDGPCEPPAPPIFRDLAPLPNNGK